MFLNALRRRAVPPSARWFHTQDTGKVFSDPRRPEVFYHLVQPPTPVSPTSKVYALSFLSRPLPNAESATILGWVPSPSELKGKSPEETIENLEWRDFRENGVSRACPRRFPAHSL